MVHINDILLEPIKKISFKTLVTKRTKWWWSDEANLTPGINPVTVFKDFINSPSPGMIARYGSTELTCVLAYILSKSKESFLKKALWFFKGDIPTFWFGNKNTSEICANSGFFPNDLKLIKKFSKRMLQDIRDMDILLTWLKGEKYTFEYLSDDCKIISAWDIQPFFQSEPWTMFLEGKKVLVIHPYAKSISQQYKKRHLIFPAKQILPEMDLKTFKAVQTIENNKSEFENWFEALDYMKDEVEKIDFDIALIGAGAYGLPLAADIKRMRKKAIHLGGALQIYFGIKGSRWEKDSRFLEMFNEHWVRPLPEEHPLRYKKMEGGAFW